MSVLEEVWPLFRLRVRTQRLELRVPRDDDFDELLGHVDRGIHDPATMPFAVPWTDLPPAERRRGAVQYWWTSRAAVAPASWKLELAVFHDGRAIGMQGLNADGFLGTREAITGSWLGMAHQGQGFGKEMRAAIVHFAFTCLDARWIVSSAFEDNLASQRVSLATGYEPDGIEVKERRGEAAVSRRFRLERQRWEEAAPHVAVDVDGWTPDCRTMFGL